MRILVVNDDGIGSAGIHCLASMATGLEKARALTR